MIKVWDLPLRLFHWALVILVCMSILTAEFSEIFGELDAMQWHFYSGYAVLALLLFRILWGFAGTRYARFSQFVTSIEAGLSHLRHFRSAKPVPGHNPAGGWMVLVMLATLLIQTTTGLFSTDDIFNEGPLASYANDLWQERATSLHHLIFKMILALITLHLLALAAYRFIKGEHLVAAMWHGKKTGTEGGITSQHLWLASLLLAIAVFAVWLITRL